MRKSWKLFAGGVVAALMGALFSSHASAGVYLTGREVYHRQYGQSRDVFDAVGQIGVYDRNLEEVAVGSGVLINNRWVLTTASLLQSATNEDAGSSAFVFFYLGEFGDPIQGPPRHPFDPRPPTSGEIFTGRQRYVADAWYTPRFFRGIGELLAGYDIALVDLGPNAVPGQPKVARLPRQNSRLGFGRSVDVVGYGLDGSTVASDSFSLADLTFADGYSANYRRGGSNRLDGRLTDLIPVYINPRSGENEPPLRSVVSHISFMDLDNGLRANALFDDGVFNKNDFPVSREYLPAYGDGGGGVFYGDTLVGLPSGVYTFGGAIRPNSVAFLTEVSTFTNWIRRVIANVERGDTSQPWLARRSDSLQTLVIEDSGTASGAIRPLVQEGAPLLGPGGGN